MPAPPPALATKPHYAVLDGLRGVAALTVVAFHLCEAHATSHLDQLINHGYLAVDFFFLLSGYVIGYAYDDRWPRLSIAGFFRNRLIRLQPMVVMGMLIGAATFYFQASPLWPGIAGVPGWKLLLVLLIGCTLLPVPAALDIRGWREMHPLNGPGWSLFFEYMANILYALGVRRLPRPALAALVVLCGAALLHYAVTSATGDVIGGWSLDKAQLRIGFSRMMYPFFAGLLLSRLGQPGQLGRTFLGCSALLLLVLAFPRVGGAERLWLNGLYDALSIIVVFPVLVWLGASGQPGSPRTARLCKALGDLSYPLYITHYPLIYLYTGWVSRQKPAWPQALWVGGLTFGAAVVLAWLCLRYYDEPVRRWLQRRRAVVQ